MNPEDIVEVFVATIIIGVGVVIITQISYPEIGQLLLGILPAFVEFMVYLLIITILGSMLYQLVD